jgi:hypothetical protein
MTSRAPLLGQPLSTNTLSPTLIPVHALSQQAVSRASLPTSREVEMGLGMAT